MIDDHRERVRFGLGPVQLDWPGAFGARAAGRTAYVHRVARALRAAGIAVRWVGEPKMGGRALTWSAVDDLPVLRVERQGGGKSRPGYALLDPTFVEARRAATVDPASTFARRPFRPVVPMGPVGSVRPG